MPMTKEQLLAEAKALDPREREALVEEIWLTLDDARTSVEAAWIEECKRRIAAVDRGEMPTTPGNQVMRDLFERLK